MSVKDSASFRGKTAVVTGGAGFVPSHLIERLLADGLKVVALDNFVTGHRRNIEHLVGNPDFRFIEHDVSEPFEVEGPVDFVFHMASPASPIDYVKIPVETLKAGSSRLPQRPRTRPHQGRDLSRGFHFRGLRRS
ncbi:MAG: NAD-dependent epimerase/dehydratase family protein [Luteolibacter sp.]